MYYTLATATTNYYYLLFYYIKIKVWKNAKGKHLISVTFQPPLKKKCD